MSSSNSKTTKAEPDPAFTSYSLNYEDVILNRLFPKQRRGFYVDVGAGHPRFENDLFALYERGWSGINVEPNEHFFELHQQIRPRDQNVCMVLSDAPSEPLTYYQIDGSGLSTCDEAQAKAHAAHGHTLRARSVEVGTLAGLLTEAGARFIDILKVDVEGFEEKVLSGNDWERFRPSVVLVEATYPESQERRPTNIRGFMEQRGYHHVLFDGLNDFYLENSFQEPPGLALPPSVFDHFIPREVADLRRQAELLRASFAEAERYALSLKANQDEHGRALSVIEALATENRKLQQQIRSQTNNNRRLQSAADQMRVEITALNRMFEPLHAALEHSRHVASEHSRQAALERNRQAEANRELEHKQQAELERSRQLGRDHDNRVERLNAEIREAHARLHLVYASRSWTLTKPWRLAGRILKQLKR